MECLEAIISYVVEKLDVAASCHEYQILVITPQKLNDKLNAQLLNLLFDENKFKFDGVTILNQSLASLYAYNTAAGVIVNLGEKIEIVPISNGIIFQSGVSNLSYGGSIMSEYLNSYITRSHVK